MVAVANKELFASLLHVTADSLIGFDEAVALFKDKTVT